MKMWIKGICHRCNQEKMVCAWYRFLTIDSKRRAPMDVYWCGDCGPLLQEKHSDCGRRCFTEMDYLPADEFFERLYS